MINKCLGIDPSLRGCGVSNGKEHIVIKTEPSDLETPSGNLLRRCQEIIAKLVIFINQNYSADDEILVVVEAPVLNAMGGAHHPFECGWLYNELYTRLPSMVGQKLTIIEVPTSTLRKWAVGKGNMPKDLMKLQVYKKFGVEFELDPGSDKLFAWLLYKYGVSVLEKSVEHVPIARRGKGKKNAKRTRDTKKSSENLADKPVVRKRGTAKASRGS